MKTQDEYLESPNNCPKCGSDQTEGGFVETGVDGAHQPRTCLDCGLEWYDLYKLVGFQRVEEA